MIALLVLLSGLADSALDNDGLPTVETLAHVHLRLCTPSAPHSESHHHLPNEDNLTWCFGLSSDKRSEPTSKMGEFSRFRALVYLTYSTLDKEQQGIACQLKFKGYRGRYELSPDFGGYTECQNVYAAQRHALATSTALHIPSPNECPILDLPSTEINYHACPVPSNTWIHLHFRSVISFQLRNHTRVEREWDEDRLLSTHTSVRHDPGAGVRPYLSLLQDHSCRPRLLLALHPHFPTSLSFTLSVILIPEGDVVTEERERKVGMGRKELSVESPWLQLRSPRIPSIVNVTFSMELCFHRLTIQLSNSTRTLLHRHCTPLTLLPCRAHLHPLHLALLALPMARALL